MKTSLAFLLLLAADYRAALPGYHYEFPRDHFSHPDFQTEWWYYTGNLRAADGHRFGFELTFFRHGVNRDSAAPQLWDVRDLWFAHLALSDIDGGRFHHTQRINRQGPGLAGASLSQSRVWNGNWESRWTLDPQAPGGVRQQQLTAIADNFRFQLTARPQKPPVIHGVNGASQKAEGAGRASHYVSFTRLATTGTITVEGRAYQVEGFSWMDHEFFTHQLEPNQSGWDWFSLQFDDNSELMVFRLRRKDGALDRFSAGTYIDPQGRTRHLTHQDFQLLPGKTWSSPDTAARYPIAWTLSVPSLQLEAALSTSLPGQELTARTSTSPVYWEGAIAIQGRRAGRSLQGAGYLEMTGYAGPVNLGP